MNVIEVKAENWVEHTVEVKVLDNGDFIKGGDYFRWVSSDVPS